MDDETQMAAAADETLRRIGALLLYWGQLETRLSLGIYQMTVEFREVSVAPDSVARSLDRTLKDWRRAHVGIAGDKTPHLSEVDRLKGEIEAASTMRNALCHGFDSMAISPRPPYATACCFEKYHENRMIHGKVRQVFYDLPALGSEMERIEDFQRRARELNQSACEMLHGKRGEEAR